MKRKFLMFVCFILMFALLTSCNAADKESDSDKTDGGTSVVDDSTEKADGESEKGQEKEDKVDETVDENEGDIVINDQDQPLAGIDASLYLGNDDLRITIQDKIFVLGGKQFWVNGTNTPWNNWNDFGGNFNAQWWDDHFAKLHENGVNATRVWINCNGDGAIEIDENGFISGASDKHWTDLDTYFSLAAKHEIYVMATFTSFDHFKKDNTKFMAWRAMLQNNDAIDSFVKNYTIPFLERYGNNPYLWSIDLCNEPDWIFEESKVDWQYISAFFARNAAAIHKNSDVLVTVGMGLNKYNSDSSNCEGNKVSDAYLQNLYADDQAFLDFWSPHYYPWVGEWFYTPFYKTPAGWGLDDSKPALIGETAAVGSDNYYQTYSDTGWPNKPEPEKKTLIDNYETAYLNGWQGVMPWTSNGVDGCGGFEDLVPATNYMLEKYPELVFPLKAE